MSVESRPATTIGRVILGIGVLMIFLAAFGVTLPIVNLFMCGVAVAFAAFFF